MSTHLDPDNLSDTFLTERMDHAVRGLQVDADVLAAGAVGRGRPIRRRRHALTAVAGLAAFGLVGGVAYAWNGPVATPEQPRVVQPADVPSASPAPTRTATPVTRPLSARVVALRLERGLGLDLTDFTGQGSSGDEIWVGATAAEDERTGASLNVQPAFDDRSIYTCPATGGCRVTRGEDGSISLLRTDREGDYVKITADRLDADELRTVLVLAQPRDGADGVSAEQVDEAAERIGAGFSRAPSATEVAEAEKKVVPWTSLDDESTTTPTPIGRSVDHEVTARLAALYLSRLAPGTAAGEYRGFGDGDTAGAVVMISRDRPELPGKAALRVVVDGDAPLPGCDDPALDSCTTSIPRAGVEMRQAVRRSVTMGEETDVITVDVRTPGGALVTVTGGDTARFQPGHPRAGTSLAEVTDIALDPVWDVEAEPEPADVKAADQLEPWTWMSGPDDI